MEWIQTGCAGGISAASSFAFLVLPARDGIWHKPQT
jgi:hypothetical protein